MHDSSPAPAVRPVALYARYSADSQNPRSCEQQINDMRRYVAGRHDWREVVVFTDEARSGGVGREGRPGWDALLSYIEDGHLAGGIVLTWDLDRWSRDQYDGPIARLTIQRLGVDVADTVVGIFARDFAGQVMATCKEQASAEELSKIRRRITRGIHDQVALGYWHGASPPFGYRLVRVDGGTSLEPVPEQAAIVLELFQRAAAAEPMAALARELVARGIPTATGRGVWCTATIRTILASPTYLGIVPEYHSKRERSRYRFALPSDEVLLHPGKHPGIIPRDLWEAVQALYRPCPRKRGVSPRVYPLSGLVRCTTCNRSAVIVNTHSRRAYRCTAYSVATDCTNRRTVRVDQLQDAVSAWAAGLAADHAALDLAARELMVREVEQAERIRAARRPIEMELVDLERKADAYLALIHAGNAPRLVNERLTQVQAAMDAAHARMSELGGNVEPVPMAVIREAFRETLASGARNLHRLRPLIECVELPPAPAPVVLVVAGERIELGELAPSPRRRKSREKSVRS